MERYTDDQIALMMVDDICNRLPKDIIYLKKNKYLQFLFKETNYTFIIKNHSTLGLMWYDCDQVEDIHFDHHTMKVFIFNGIFGLDYFGDDIEFSWLVNYFSDVNIYINTVSDKDKCLICFPDYKKYIIWDKLHRKLCNETDFKNKCGISVISYLQDPFMNVSYMENY